VLRFHTVIFDCDSTLSALEGIEELAAGHREEVRRLTAQAMEGTLRLEEVYARRLELARPSRDAVERLGERYIERLVPGAERVVRELQDAGVTVWILSAGLAPAVRRLARHLEIPEHQVAAVEVTFDPQGAYAGFDAASPLTRSGGKRIWIETARSRLAPPILLVGDGITDLEARPAVDLFVAFAGVARRPLVMAQADVVLDGPGLEGLLPLVVPAA
jgi:phosphoserine phosphatase